jgi:hypothetical protein
MADQTSTSEKHKVLFFAIVTLTAWRSWAAHACVSSSPGASLCWTRRQMTLCRVSASGEFDSLFGQIAVHGWPNFDEWKTCLHKVLFFAIVTLTAWRSWMRSCMRFLKPRGLALLDATSNDVMSGERFGWIWLSFCTDSSTWLFFAMHAFPQAPGPRSVWALRVNLTLFLDVYNPKIVIYWNFHVNLS